VVTSDYVRARWAYSELLSLRHGHLYQGRGLPELKEKSRQKVPFGVLTVDEGNLLALNFNEVRGGYFNRFFAGVIAFKLVRLSRAKVGALHIIPYFNQWLEPEHVVGRTTFKDWIEAKPLKRLPADHVLATNSNGSHYADDHPATVGDGRVLIDGYHRAVRLWQTDDLTATLAAYVPVP
jgi:hypothetical protein